MRLPNCGQAEVSLGKITDYLLSHSHPEGRTKARYCLYGNDGAYEVEFTTMQGKTVALATVPAKLVRSVGNRDLFHVRKLGI